MHRYTIPLLALLLFTFDTPAVTTAEESYIFTAPPRGSAEKETKVYAPIAEYMTEITGKKFVYRHPGNWLSYQRNMQRGAYDLVFDGPHFVAWRMAKAKHMPLVSLPGKLAFVVFTSAGNKDFTKVSQLKGRTVCGLAPPNLATLTLYDQFKNPLRQPLVIEVRSFPKGYQAVMSGKCVAGVMRDKMFFKLNKKANKGKVIFHSRGIANQAFSAGPRLTKEDQQKITDALLSPTGFVRMKNFHARFNKKGKPLSRATVAAYRDHWKLLKDVWGFEVTKNR